MTTKRIVTLDRVSLRLPRGADADAVLREVARAIGEGATAPSERLRVVAPPSVPGEGPQALAHRLGRATAARLKSGDGT